MSINCEDCYKKQEKKIKTLQEKLEKQKRISDLAINCIYEVEDALYRGSKNDWATEAINEFNEELKPFESEKEGENL